MGNDPLKGENRKKELKSRIIWVLILSSYLGAFIGSERLYYESKGEDLLSNISAVIEDIYSMREMALPILHTKISLPGALCLIPTDPGMIFVGLLIGSIYALNLYTEFISKGKERKGEEYGSGAFNTGYDHLINNYVMSPPLLKKAMINGEIKISRSDYLCWKVRKVLCFGHKGRKKKAYGLHEKAQ